MITTIIFDIGNVLAEFTWKEHYESFGYDEQMVERIAKATVKNPDWNEFDRGAMSEEEIVQAFVKADPEIEEDIWKVLQNVSTMIKRLDYAIPWIQELKSKGYRVLYLSNFSNKAETDCAHALDFIPVTDGGILSCEEKLIKPQPEIYLRLLEKYSLKAEECVFLDDLETNVEAARAQGFYGIVFTTKEDAVSQLAALGVHS